MPYGWEGAGAQFPLGDVGRMGGGVEDQGAAVRAFGEQAGQRVEAADAVAILGDGAPAVALGDELMAAVGMNGEHAIGSRAQHVDEVGEPFGGVVGGVGASVCMGMWRSYRSRQTSTLAIQMSCMVVALVMQRGRRRLVLPTPSCGSPLCPFDGLRLRCSHDVP